jgi:hypothetical protein
MAFPTTRCRRRDPRLLPLLMQFPASDLGVRQSANYVGGSGAIRIDNVLRRQRKQNVGEKV